MVLFVSAWLLPVFLENSEEKREENEEEEEEEEDDLGGDGGGGGSRRDWRYVCTDTEDGRTGSVGQRDMRRPMCFATADLGI